MRDLCSYRSTCTGKAVGIVQSLDHTRQCFSCRAHLDAARRWAGYHGTMSVAVMPLSFYTDGEQGVLF